MGETRTARSQRVRHSSPALAPLGIVAAAALVAVISSATPGRCAIDTGTAQMPAAVADGSEQAGKTVDLDLANADLHDVVDMVRRQTGANIIVQDGDKPFGKVNVHLSRVSLNRALNSIAMSASANVSMDGDTYIIRSGYADPSPVSSPVQVAAAPQLSYRAQDLHWYKIILVHAVPREVLYMMHWDKDVRPDLTQAPMAPPPTPSSPAIITMTGEPVPSVPAGTGNVGPAAANYSVDETGDNSQSHQFQGPPGYLGGGGFNPNQGFGGAGGGGGAGAGAQLPDGVEQIYALQGDNSLVFHATRDAYLQLRTIVKYLDIAPRQVQIKVEFVRADVTDTDSFGINYTLIPYPGVSISSNLLTGGAGSYGMNFAFGNLVGQMEAQLTKNRAKVVASPIITTTNNVPANIFVQQSIPYTTTTTVIPTSGNNVTNTQQNFLQVNTTLNVTPRINSDDTVTLALNPQIATPGATPAGGGPPPVTTQGLQTTRTVRNGETMVLGGLINDNESVTRTGIPILMDLPIIGGLFRNRLKTVSDSELLIFITPTIIGDNLDSPATSSGGSIAP